MKPFAESSEQNKQVILEVLRTEYPEAKSVLEIGSGTGQHAVFFAAAMPWLTWYASDTAEYLPGIQMWLDDYLGSNLHGPLLLDVSQEAWPLSLVDAVFSANTAHIMHWPEVEAMFAGVGRVLNQKGVFCLYGPFNYNGQYTSDSNARFDAWLQARDPASGIRDLDALESLAAKYAMQLLRDHEMPVNNRILVWGRT